jgi:hypothetical protein
MAVFMRILFVLATKGEITSFREKKSLLNMYKAQHIVKHRFRSKKNPGVAPSSFYVKKPELVEALLFVMAS